jgi:hypothetical protein
MAEGGGRWLDGSTLRADAVMLDVSMARRTYRSS